MTSTTSPKVGVVILNYNTSHLLRQFIPLTLLRSGKHDIIVADNASTDNSVEVMQQLFPQVRLICMDKNHGFAGGYNKALPQLDYDYFILLNSDVEVTEGWIDPMLTFMENHPECAACQPKINAWRDKDFFEYAGASGGYIDFAGYPFCRGRIFGTLEKDEGQYNTPTRVFWGSGACLMIRRDIFVDAGGFDEHFFAHMEEIDLCWRLNNRGWQIYCIPDSTVYHIGGGTLDVSNPRKTFLNFRNNFAMLYKNRSRVKFLCLLPLKLVLDWAAAALFLFQGKAADAKAILQAHIAVRQMIGRREVRRDEKAGKPVEKNLKLVLYSRLLVLDYYLLGKRKFSQLGRF